MSQTVNTTRTDYLLDLQAGLPKVLAATTGTNTERYIHAIRGLHATEDSNGAWTYALEDALGSVRGTIGSGRQFQSTHNYDPYGNPDTTITGFAFTGEPRDANGLQYHRARYYNPSLAIFPSLDPYPGTMARPMSLNGYAYVEGNTPNRTDPTGMCSKTQPDCTGLIGNPLAFWACINGFPWPPTPMPSCSLEQHVERIAAFARQEANQEQGQLIPTAAAIALAEINVINVGNSPRSRSTTYPDRTRWVNANDSSTILTLASRFVEGSCSGKLVEVVKQQASQFSELTGYGAALEFVAQNPTVMYEHSFKSDNLVAGIRGIITNPNQTGIKSFEDFPTNARDSQGNIVEPFKGIVIRGSTLSVVVSNDFNPLPLEWNCSVGQNAVVSADYNPNTDGGQNFAAGLSCKSCIPSTREWWWTRNFVTFEKLSEADFQDRVVATGIGGWIASCNE